VTANHRKWWTAITFLACTLNVEATQVRVVRYGDDRLTGIHEVDLLVTGDTAHGRCAVNRGAIERVAVEALTASRIKASVSAKARSFHYSIVTDVITREASGNCASGITTELVAEVTGMPEADRTASPGVWGSMLVGMMPLARDNALVIVPPVEHDAAVQREIESQVAAIAARIRSANP
jgi:hypothetical protein